MPVHHALARDERPVERTRAENGREQELVLRNHHRCVQNGIVAVVGGIHDGRLHETREHLMRRHASQAIVVVPPGRSSEHRHLRRDRRCGDGASEVASVLFPIAETLEVRVHLCQLRLVVAPQRVRPGRQRQIIAVAAVAPFAKRHLDDDVLGVHDVEDVAVLGITAVACARGVGRFEREGVDVFGRERPRIGCQPIVEAGAEDVRHRSAPAVAGDEHARFVEVDAVVVHVTA